MRGIGAGVFVNKRAHVRVCLLRVCLCVAGDRDAQSGWGRTTQRGGTEG